MEEDRCSSEEEDEEPVRGLCSFNEVAAYTVVCRRCCSATSSPQTLAARGFSDSTFPARWAACRCAWSLLGAASRTESPRRPLTGLATSSPPAPAGAPTLRAVCRAAQVPAAGAARLLEEHPAPPDLREPTRCMRLTTPRLQPSTAPSSSSSLRRRAAAPRWAAATRPLTLCTGRASARVGHSARLSLSAGKGEPLLRVRPTRRAWCARVAAWRLSRDLAQPPASRFLQTPTRGASFHRTLWDSPHRKPASMQVAGCESLSRERARHRGRTGQRRGAWGHGHGCGRAAAGSCWR